VSEEVLKVNYDNEEFKKFLKDNTLGLSLLGRGKEGTKGG